MNLTLLSWLRSACCSCLFYVLRQWVQASPMFYTTKLFTSKNTIFLVDRFHWQWYLVWLFPGWLHITQRVNEQANAGCKGSKDILHTRSQITVCFIYGLQNMDDQSKLDIGNLKLWCVHLSCQFYLHLDVKSSGSKTGWLARIIQNRWKTSSKYGIIILEGNKHNRHPQI